MSALVELGGKVLSDRFRCRGRRITRGHQSVPVYQEFCEIPGYVLFTRVIGSLLFQPFVQVAGPGTVDFDLGEHWEVDLIAGRRELQNFSF